MSHTKQFFMAILVGIYCFSLHGMTQDTVAFGPNNTITVLNESGPIHIFVHDMSTLVIETSRADEEQKKFSCARINGIDQYGKILFQKFLSLPTRKIIISLYVPANTRIEAETAQEEPIMVNGQTTYHGRISTVATLMSKL